MNDDKHEEMKFGSLSYVEWKWTIKMNNKQINYVNECFLKSLQHLKQNALDPIPLKAKIGLK